MLELMAVMGILCVLVALAVPRFNGVLDYIQLKKDAVQICREIRLARQRAIATGSSNQVRFYPDHNFYRLYQPVLQDRKLGRGIRFSYVSFPRDTRGWVMCQFSPLGVPTAGGTVALENRRGQRLYVIVNPVAGRVRISRQPPLEK